MTEKGGSVLEHIEQCFEFSVIDKPCRITLQQHLSNVWPPGFGDFRCPQPIRHQLASFATSRQTTSAMRLNTCVHRTTSFVREGLNVRAFYYRATKQSGTGHRVIVRIIAISVTHKKAHRWMGLIQQERDQLCNRTITPARGRWCFRRYAVPVVVASDNEYYRHPAATRAPAP